MSAEPVIRATIALRKALAGRSFPTPADYVYQPLDYAWAPHEAYLRRYAAAGPRRVLMSLGYAGWGEGQLESEIGENTWLTVPADARIVFDTPLARRYDEALGLLGLQSWMLSPEAGHA